MDAEELAHVALRAASELQERMSRELQDASGGDTSILHDAVRVVLKTEASADHVAIQLLDAAIQAAAPPETAQRQAVREIILRTRDLTLSAATQLDRNGSVDVLRTTAEALWGASVTGATVLLDGPNFQIVEIVSDDGSVRTGSFTWSDSVPPAGALTGNATYPA